MVVEVGDAVAFSRAIEAGDADVDLNVPVQRLVELGAKYPVNKDRLFAVPSPNVFYLYARPAIRK
jgi:hypothetical protein